MRKPTNDDQANPQNHKQKEEEMVESKGIVFLGESVKDQFIKECEIFVLDSKRASLLFAEFKRYFENLSISEKEVVKAIQERLGWEEQEVVKAFSVMSFLLHSAAVAQRKRTIENVQEQALKDIQAFPISDTVKRYLKGMFSEFFKYARKVEIRATKQLYTRAIVPSLKSVGSVIDFRAVRIDGHTEALLPMAILRLHCIDYEEKESFFNLQLSKDDCTALAQNLAEIANDMGQISKKIQELEILS